MPDDLKPGRAQVEGCLFQGGINLRSLAETTRQTKVVIKTAPEPPARSWAGIPQIQPKIILEKRAGRVCPKQNGNTQE